MSPPAAIQANDAVAPELVPATRKTRQGKGISPTQRSLLKLREEGWTCAIVEKFNPWVKIRQDLFGFADILAFNGDTVLLVQTTTGDHVNERIKKIQDLPVAVDWKNGVNRRIVVHGWRKLGARGKRKLWECREVEL